MKKLMIALSAAALCGAVFADGVASANVVGYQNIATPAGSSMRTATFKALSGEYKISDIKVEGAVGAGNDFAQLINADGTWGTQYFYLLDAETGCGEDGWYLDMFGSEPVTDMDVLTVGQAFIFTSEVDVSFVVAGEVRKGNVVVSIPAGSSIIGNPTPVTAKLSEVIATGAIGAGNDFGQMINADGTWGTQYWYLTDAETGCGEDGWFLDMFGSDPVTDVDILTSGDSMIFTAETDFLLSFPAVL